MMVDMKIDIRRIAIGAFEDDDSATITVDGLDVGYVERVKSVNWSAYDSSTSRCLAKFERVAGYTITLWDDRAEMDVEFEKRIQLRAHVAEMLVKHGSLETKTKGTYVQAVKS